MTRIGIVGTGNIVGIAHYHAAGLLNDGRCEIAAVYDTRLSGAEEWVREHSLSSRVCRSYEELLDSVDAVNICVPNRFHFGYAEKALKADKHFFVEKPMALTLEESAALNDLASEYGKVDMVGFVYRFSSAVQKAREIVRNDIGKVYTLSAWFGGKRIADPAVPKEWRMTRSLSGSGALGDFGSHIIDLADFIAGQRVTEVQCLSDTFIKMRTGRDGRMEEVENDDASVLSCRTTDGLSSFTFSRTGMDDIMMMITGEGGMLQLSLRGNGSITYWEKKRSGGYTGKVSEIPFDGQKPFDGWFDGEMSAYLDWIEGDKGFCGGVDQGYYVEKVLHEAEAAAGDGKVREIRI